MPSIAYIVSAFPAVTETFVLYDILMMEQLGVTVELYPLRRLREKVVHSECEQWMERAHYEPFLSFSILRSQWHFISKNWKVYFKTLAEVLRRTWGSPDYFLGGLIIFPKVVQFARDMERRGIRHVHAHFANHPATAAFIIHELTGIPFSFTARGTDIQVDRHMLKEKVHAAEFAIAVSSHNRQIVVDHCGRQVESKIHVVHGGVDVDRLAPQTSCDGIFRILCVARFEEVKGHSYLVEACCLLKQRGVPFECRLIGNGPLLSTVELQIDRLHLKDAVRLLGAREYSGIVDEFKRASVVVLSTAPTASGKREGVPNALKEAMACGLPVIASDVGGIPELVDHDDNGILVPPRDAQALAEALLRLYSDRSLRQRMGQRGREKIVREFNLKVSCKKRAELFLNGSGSDVPLFLPETGERESASVTEELPV
jgi:colanic acid/amylovoran biosynthesis glycosyltransferase